MTFHPDENTSIRLLSYQSVQKVLCLNSGTIILEDSKQSVQEKTLKEKFFKRFFFVILTVSFCYTIIGRDNAIKLLLPSMRYSLVDAKEYTCLLYTSPSPRDGLLSRMPSCA